MVMSRTVQRAAGTTVPERYEALFRVSQTLISVFGDSDAALQGLKLVPEETHDFLTSIVLRYAGTTPIA
jgi:hypothetical protein